MNLAEEHWDERTVGDRQEEFGPAEPMLGGIFLEPDLDFEHGTDCSDCASRRRSLK